MSDYVVAEKDIKTIIDDFEVFCQFVDDRKPKLGKATEELGKKDCFALNALLSRPRAKDGPKYLQGAYPTIDLLFYLSLTAGLLVPGANKNSVAAFLSPSPMLEQYRALNPFDRYMFLFRTYWTLVDYCRLYDDSLYFHSNAFKYREAGPGGTAERQTRRQDSGVLWVQRQSSCRSCLRTVHGDGTGGAPPARLRVLGVRGDRNSGVLRAQERCLRWVSNAHSSGHRHDQSLPPASHRALSRAPG